jgi:hypothetical protein
VVVLVTAEVVGELLRQSNREHRPPQPGQKPTRATGADTLLLGLLGQKRRGSTDPAPTRRPRAAEIRAERCRPKDWQLSA